MQDAKRGELQSSGGSAEVGGGAYRDVFLEDVHEVIPNQGQVIVGLGNEVIQHCITRMLRSSSSSQQH
jgi:hypothetical protein